MNLNFFKEPSASCDLQLHIVLLQQNCDPLRCEAKENLDSKQHHHGLLKAYFYTWIFWLFKNLGGCQNVTDHALTSVDSRWVSRIALCQMFPS